MRAAALSRDELQPRSPGGGWPGLALSVLVHAGLLAVLLWGFRWETPSTDMVSAELWAATPQAAPAAAVTPAALPPPAPPVPVPPPRAVTPPPKPVPAIVTPDADIALEKARRAKAEQERVQREKAAEKDREDKARKAKDERERREQEERAAKAEKMEKAEKAAKAEKAEKAAQAERDAKARETERREKAAADKALARQREENLARMMGQLGTAGSSTAKAGGVAAGAPGGGGGGPSASYAGRLIQAIKPNIVFGETLTGNPAAEVEVRAGPTGSIIGRTLVKSSGHPEWDEAVLRAIDRTATLPKDTDGRVPPRLTITFRPRD